MAKSVAKNRLNATKCGCNSLGINGNLKVRQSRLRHKTLPKVAENQHFREFSYNLVWQIVANSQFKPAKLYNAGGKAGKRWYIEWKGFDCRVQQWKRLKHSIPSKLSISQRYKYAEGYIAMVNDVGRTQQGKFFSQAAQDTPGRLAKVLDIRQCVEKALAIKQAQIAARSYRDYSNITNAFLKYLADRQMAGLRMADFTKMKAITFLSDYQRENKITNKSRNNIMTVLRAVFTPLLSDGTITMNPFAGIPSLREQKGDANPPFTPKQRDALKEAYSKHCPELLDVASFIYYLLMRPIEVMRLQAKHLDFENRIVKITAMASKTDEVRHPKISDVFYEFLLQRGYDKLPGNYYLFGDDLRPAEKVTRHEDRRKRTMEQMHRNAAKKLKKISFEKIQQMYSWKSTGAIDLYREGTKMKYIQHQCGHRSIVTTEIYLKNLGALDDDFLKEINAKQRAL